MPSRIQRSRAKGWEKPEGAVYVGRPTKWANPWPVAAVNRGLVQAFDWQQIAKSSPLYLMWTQRSMTSAADVAATVSVNLFREAATRFRDGSPEGFSEWIQPLRGKSLMCWCSPGEPCHADVLMEFAATPAVTSNKRNIGE